MVATVNSAPITPLKKIIWRPQPRQRVLLSCPADETFFGGAKGGGKTDGMLGDFAAHAKRYGKNAVGIFMRRSYPELEEAIRRSYQIFVPLGATFKISKNVWTFPNGATLKMRHIEKDADTQKYQGHSYSWICLDELGNYPSPYIYNQMLSCLRSAHEGVVCQMRATGNPGGPGHGWIKRRFIDGQQPDHIYTFETKIPMPDGTHKSVEFTRAFIPSKVTDNTKLIENDPQYLAKLHMLPDHLKRAFLFGDWDVFVGQVFSEIREDKHYVENMLIPADWTRFATLDWGYAKPYSVGFWAVSPHGRLYRITEDYGCVDGMEDEGVQLDATTVAKKILPIINMMGIRRVYADPAIWQKHGHGAGLSIASLFQKVGIPIVPGKKDRKAALSVIHNMLQNNLDDGYPMLQIFKDTCPGWVRTVPNLVGAKSDIEDVDTNGEDHIYDDMRYAVLAPEVVNASKNWLNRMNTMPTKYGAVDKDYAL
jgi:hypothetical protein